VISEGAYGRFEEVMDISLDSLIPGTNVFLRPMVWLASAEAHINPSAIVPLNSAAKWKKPALVVQGEKDKLIPLHQAKELAAAANCSLWIVPGAAHAECFSVARKEFLDRLTALAHSL